MNRRQANKIVRRPDRYPAAKVERAERRADAYIVRAPNGDALFLMGKHPVFCGFGPWLEADR